MKKFALILLLGGFVLTSCQKDDLSSQVELDATASRVNSNGNNASAEFTLDDFTDCEATSKAFLYAGQNTLVGEVNVELVDGYYNVVYTAYEGYCFSEVHFISVDSPLAFPLKGTGNPNPGGFDYKDDTLECEPTVSFSTPDNGPYLAAHAVVNCVSETAESIAGKLPDMASFSTLSPAYPGSLGAYFDVSVVDGMLTGQFPAWCADVKKPLSYPEGPFPSHVFSTYEDFPYNAVAGSNGIIKDNMDLVNWLINNKGMFIGMESPTGGFYNFGDVQWAIWWLLNEAGCISCEGLGDKDDLIRKGTEIVNAIPAEAEGYVPGCGEYLLIILIPKEGPTQPLMIPYYIPCGDCDETAWGRNGETVECGEFPGGNWATYFLYGDDD